MADLSGKYTIATKKLTTGDTAVFLVDPQTGIIIAQLFFQQQISRDTYGKIADDLDDLLSREI